MPAIGETALSGPPPKLAVGPPKPTKAPSVQSVIRGVANRAGGAATRGVGATVRAAAPTARPVARAVIAPQRGVQTGPIVPTGNAYKQAVLETFAHQPPAARQAVVKGALRTPSFEGNLILSAIGGHGIPSLGQQMTGTGSGKGLTQYLNAQNAKSPNVLKDIGGFLKTLAPGNNPYWKGAGAGAPAHVSGGGGTIPGIGTVSPFGGSAGAKQILGNAAKDVVNLPAETFSTVGTLGGDVLHGQFGKLASDSLGQYAKIAEDPVGSFYQHPVNTALAVAAPLAGVTKVAADAARAVAPDSALARALGPTHEVPPSVKLTGNLTHERPALSPYPLTRAAQKLAAAGLYKTNEAGHLVPRTEFLRERLLRQEVSRSLVGVRERIRSAAVASQRNAHAESMLASPGKRLAVSAAKALTYNPGSALIHGANVLARVTDHTARTPETLIADLQKHLDSVAATRPDLEGLKAPLAEHDKYVGQLKAAINDKALAKPKNAALLFAAAHKYAQDIKPLQDEAFTHGHYGDLTKEALTRRELQPVVLSHMPGARLDEKLGMVKDASPAEADRLAPDRTKPAIFRGTRPGTARSTVGAIHDAPRWDKQFFVTHSQKIAEGYAGPKGHVEKYHVKPDAKVLHVSESELPSPSSMPGAPSEFEHAQEIVDKARATGYDIVHFPDQQWLGSIVLNPDVLSKTPLDLSKGAVRTRKLSTPEMVAFDKAQTGGRPLAYTSHGEPKGDSAFYINQHQYPAKVSQKNTGYAFTHGLTDPTHEALLQHRVQLEGVINAHRAMDKILTSTAVGHPNGGFWGTFKDAKADRLDGQVPVQVGRMTSKDSTGEILNPAALDHEAQIRSLDINERLRPTDTPGKFGLMDKTVVDQLRAHQNQISPNTFMRAARASTGQFRRVALGTSIRHIPGVTQEGLIRDIGAGEGVRSLVSGRNVFKELEKIDPRLAAERRTELAGGTLAGMTRSMETRQGSKYFGGTVLGPPMKAVEKLFKSPGPRQLSTAWNSWQNLVINGSKKVLEQNQQMGAVGQELLKQSDSLMVLQGRAAQDAAKGLMSDQTARQLSAQVRRVHGTWTDLTPSGQTALMFSPFGMWWVNSVKWLARMPVDQPIKTGLLASATTGTQKQRQAEGLDMFSPGHLADYLQGSIPVNNKLIASQYYSPQGMANDFSGTAASLIEPTLTPMVLALLGDNWLGRPLKSPSDPTGQKTPNQGEKMLVALNSVLSNFLPLYTKFQTARQGGASSYDTSTGFAPQTKGPNPGIWQGLLKDIQPLRQYPNPGVGTASPSTAKPWYAPSSSSSGKKGWYSPATSTAKPWYAPTASGASLSAPLSQQLDPANSWRDNIAYQDWMRRDPFGIAGTQNAISGRFGLGQMENSRDGYSRPGNENLVPVKQPLRINPATQAPVQYRHKV